MKLTPCWPLCADVYGFSAEDRRGHRHHQQDRLRPLLGQLPRMNEEAGERADAPWRRPAPLLPAVRAVPELSTGRSFRRKIRRGTLYFKRIPLSQGFDNGSNRTKEENMVKGKERATIWFTPSVKAKIKEHYRADNCRNQIQIL